MIPNTASVRRSAVDSPSEALGTAVVVGGSAGVGRALVGELARRGHPLLIVATGARDLAAIRSDVEATHGVRVETVVEDLSGGIVDADAVVDRWESIAGPAECVLFPIGYVSDEDDLTTDSAVVDRTNHVNYHSVVGLSAAFARRFRERGRGTLTAFSSIAAHAPRGRNMAYAAAKASLETWYRSLRHSLATTDVRVQVYVLGYVDTSMSFGQKLLFPVAKPRYVASRVAGNLGRDVGVRFLPWYWRFVTLLLGALPWAVYKRLRF